MIKGNNNIVYYIKMAELYDFNYLLSRVYDKNGPIGEKGIKSKIVLKQPIVFFRNKRTIIQNFEELSASVNRDIMDIFNFFKEELQCDMTMNDKKEVFITGRFNGNQIGTVYAKYVKRYVQCASCRGANTVFEKRERILFIVCKTCKCANALNNK